MAKQRAQRWVIHYPTHTEVLVASASKGAAWFRLDTDTWDRIKGWSLSQCGAGDRRYLQTYCPGLGKQLLHRLIMNPGPAQEVDHQDRDTTNYCRSNLRLCSAAQNMSNRSRTSTRRFRGVRRITRLRERPWKACIAASGNTHFLGYFASEEEAARAYDVAALRLHGQFAVLNLPEML